MITYNIDSNTGFDAVNDKAKFVFVGITPGSAPVYSADKTLEGKFKAAFNGSNGSMRENLWEMLVYVSKKGKHPEITQLIDTYKSVDRMFEYNEESIVDFTSLLKNAVTFSNTEKGIKNANFNNVKEIFGCKKAPEAETQKLCNHFKEGFLYDYNERYAKDVFYIACGRQVYNFLITRVGINKDNVAAIVHPSSQAISYINRFLGKGKKPYDPETLYK